MIRWLGILAALTLAACTGGETSRLASSDIDLPPMRVFSEVNPAPTRASNAVIALGPSPSKNTPNWSGGSIALVKLSPGAWRSGSCLLSLFLFECFLVILPKSYQDQIGQVVDRYIVSFVHIQTNKMVTN